MYKTQVDFDHNLGGDKGAAALKEALLVNSTLTKYTGLVQLPNMSVRVANRTAFMATGMRVDANHLLHIRWFCCPCPCESLIGLPWWQQVCMLMRTICCIFDGSAPQHGSRVAYAAANSTKH